jgi:hypothetical protein
VVQHHHHRGSVFLRSYAVGRDASTGARADDRLVPRIPQKVSTTLDQVLPLREGTCVDDARVDARARARVPHAGDARDHIVQVHRRLDLDDGRHRIRQRRRGLAEQLASCITTLAVRDLVR